MPLCKPTQVCFLSIGALLCWSVTGEGGMSRTNQYLRYMMANLEELRMLREYRTPIMMRYANGVLLHIFAIILAPYFCHFCDSWVSYGYSWER
jgi:hypothetical protein